MAVSDGRDNQTAAGWTLHHKDKGPGFTHFDSPACGCLPYIECHDATDMTLREAVEELRAVTRTHSVQMPSVKEHLQEDRGDD